MIGWDHSGISSHWVKWSRLWKIQFNCRCFPRNLSLLVSKGVSDENFWQMPPVKKRLSLSKLMHSLVKGNLKWVTIRSGNLMFVTVMTNGWCVMGWGLKEVFQLPGQEWWNTSISGSHVPTMFRAENPG